MSEKFEFSTEVYLDGDRQIPSQINVKKNDTGVLVSHMGDDKVQGQDIYSIDVNDTVILIAASGDVILKLRKEDLADNRHLVFLAITDSHVDGLELRGSNEILNAPNVKNVSMRESKIIFTERLAKWGGAVLEDLDLVDTTLKDTLIGEIDDRNKGVRHVFDACDIRNSILHCPVAMVLHACGLEDCALSSMGGAMVLSYTGMKNVNLEFEGSIRILEGYWTNFQACRGDSIDIRNIFEMTKIETPDAPFYFYHAGEGIYCVSSHKGYREAWVDPRREEPFVDQLRKLVYDKDKVDHADYTDYQESVVQFVRDSVVSRLRVIEQLQKIAISKARGTASGQEKEGGSS